MNKAEKIQFILNKLDELYPNPPIPLNFKDAYTCTVAVLLSAQCTDKRVNDVTKVLFKKADTPKKMIKLSVEEIEDIIRPCGISKNKSKNIWNLSKILVEKFNSVVPDNFADLESLPGVGHKTASVVMSHVFNYDTFPVDTHIHRLAYRWKLSDGSNVEKTEEDLKKAFPQKLWNKLHLQIIYFGREYCKARGHDRSTCPICSKIPSRE